VNVAAKRLNKSMRTIWRWIREGKLPQTNLGIKQTRVPEAAVEALRGNQ
jgi:excisionase family DNA binding protein